MHLDEAAIQSLLIGESAPESAAAARAHLSACAECGARWAAAEQEALEIAAHLQNLDQPAPAVTLAELKAKARQPEVASEAPLHARVPRARPRSNRWMRQAAAVLVALGLLRGAYAMPGSPLPKWVASVVERVTKPARPAPAPDPDPTPEPPAEAPAPPAAAAGMSGIAVAPGPSLLILFQKPAGEGEIQVSLVDGAEVEVRAPSGAATFTSGANRILIDHPASAAVFEVSIPRAAPRVEIQVDGRRLFLKEGAAVTTATPAGAGANYVLPLISSP
jgi:hypothetical protein